MNRLRFSSIIEAKLAHSKDEVILFRGPGGNGSTTLTTGRTPRFPDANRVLVPGYRRFKNYGGPGGNRTPVSRMQTGCFTTELRAHFVCIIKVRSQKRNAPMHVWALNNL